MAVILEESLLVSKIGETIKGSLGLLNQSLLERSYTLEVSQGLVEQLISDWINLMRDITEKSSYKQLSSDLDFKSQKRFLTNVSATVIKFFERYSEFCGQDFQVELRKFRIRFDSLIDLIDGIEEIKASELKSEPAEFLEQLFYGTDLLVDVIETHAADLPVNILSVMKVVFIQLPVKAREILQSHSFIEGQDQKAGRKSLRQIDRAVNSGILRINDTVNARRNQVRVKSEEELLEAQIEHNFVPMQLIEFWLREDQQRALTKEEESEPQLIMDCINAHRDRQLFN
jgi:hypothetical protein